MSYIIYIILKQLTVSSVGNMRVAAEFIHLDSVARGGGAGRVGAGKFIHKITSLENVLYST